MPRFEEGFELKIRLGNDAMRTAADVASALEKVAERLRDCCEREDSGVVRDVNGNRVGTWELHGAEVTNDF